MATKVVAENIDYSEVDDLEHVPTHLVYYIMRYMLDTYDTLSLQAFKIFATHLGKEHRAYPRLRPMPAQTYQWHHTEPHPTSPLASYIQPLISESLDFLVQLTIGVHPVPAFGTHDFLHLTQMRNLAVLQIMQPDTEEGGFPRITDAVVRHWSEQPDPFPVLRVLRIWGADFTTPRSLQYLSKFPSLAIYDVAGRREEWRHADAAPQWNRGTSQQLLVDSALNCCGLLGNNSDEYHLRILRLLLNEFVTADRSTAGDVAVVAREDVPPPIEHKDLDGDHPNPDHVASWGYATYIHVGRLVRDQDLSAQGVSGAEAQVFVLEKSDLLPPRPFVSLGLGQCCGVDSSCGIMVPDCPRSLRRRHRCCCTVYGSRPFGARAVFVRREYCGKKGKKQDDEPTKPEQKPKSQPTEAQARGPAGDNLSSSSSSSSSKQQQREGKGKGKQPIDVDAEEAQQGSSSNNRSSGPGSGSVGNPPRKKRMKYSLGEFF